LFPQITNFEGDFNQGYMRRQMRIMQTLETK
jgi:hypothetical protein